ncbi:MAG TPA: glycosyltransferase family 4 protein [Candidatus Udaeobacter sp.]|nr:glycosyltransferase family 4 protein [Candidatus Udaeobacter sp.]
MQTSSAGPRRILMTVDPIGGVWTYALDLARALERRGIEIALASMGAQLTREQRQEVLARKNVRLFESAYRLEWMDDPWDDVDRAGEWLLGIAQRVRPDLIHLNGYSHAVLPWNTPVLVVAHSCVLSWWRAVKNEEAPARYNEYRERVTAGLSAADRVVAPSAAMRDAVAVHYGKNVNCTVVRNGRDSRPLLCGEKTSLVFSCGRVWDQAKNLQVLDQIAPHTQWPIAVAGDCRHPQGRAAALNNVRCLGKLAPRELAQQLSRAAIFVLPARYEPFGLSVLEAGLSGCALVLGDIASLRETWHGAAIFVPTKDAIGLANAINSLIENRRRRERLAQQARTRALEFSLHRMTEDYAATYRICTEAVKRRLSSRQSKLAVTQTSLLEEVAA